MNNFPDLIYNPIDPLEYDPLVEARTTVRLPYSMTLQKCVNCGQEGFWKLRQDELRTEDFDPGVLIHLTDEEVNVLKWLTASLPVDP